MDTPEFGAVLLDDALFDLEVELAWPVVVPDTRSDGTASEIGKF
jgi:hypothetical protein